MLARHALLSGLIAIGVGMSAVDAARAQSYPTRLIKLVVPAPPGGSSEIVVRPLAERLSSSLGQTMIVENLPGGAGGTVGAKAVAGAAPDGYTLLFSAPGALVVAPAIYRNLGYDPASFVPIAALFSSPQMLVVNPAVPAKSMQELVAYAKANPGKISFASPGYGTQPHLLGEMLKLLTGIDIVHVPYRGPAAPVTDLLAGQVQMEFENIPLLLPHIAAGTLRALAVADQSRVPQLPDVPTTVESGYARLQATFWSGVVAPAGTPPSIVDKLNVAINEIMRSKELEGSLVKLSAKPKLGSPQEFAFFIAAERQKWTELVHAAGIKAE